MLLLFSYGEARVYLPLGRVFKSFILLLRGSLVQRCWVYSSYKV